VETKSAVPEAAKHSANQPTKTRVLRPVEYGNGIVAVMLLALAWSGFR
jgi:hypothetical protein